MRSRIGRWTACLAVLMFGSAPATGQVFRDDFTGAELDPTVWSIDLGDGSVMVSEGNVALSCAGSSFPVVATLNDPFPPGEFRVRVRMKYLSQERCGDGLGAMDNFWENYHGANVCRPFLLWQDSGGHYVYSGSSGYVWLGPSAGSDWHVYEWLYASGQYQFSMDGVIRASGECATRATRFFFGHPHPIGCSPWTSFAIDFIEIEPFGATASRAASWGQLKEAYR